MGCIRPSSNTRPHPGNGCRRSVPALRVQAMRPFELLWPAHPVRCHHDRGSDICHLAKSAMATPPAACGRTVISNRYWKAAPALSPGAAGWATQRQLRYLVQTTAHIVGHAPPLDNNNNNTWPTGLSPDNRNLEMARKISGQNPNDLKSHVLGSCVPAGCMVGVGGL